MNQLNNLEEEFKKVLEGISYDVDTSVVWQDIKGELPIKKKKRRSPFWLLFGVFALALSGVSVMLVLEQENAIDSLSQKTDITEIKQSQNTPNIYDKTDLNQGIKYESNAKSYTKNSKKNQIDKLTKNDDVIRSNIALDLGLENNQVNNRFSESTGLLNQDPTLNMKASGKENLNGTYNARSTNHITKNPLESILDEHRNHLSILSLIKSQKRVALISNDRLIPQIGIDYETQIIPLNSQSRFPQFFTELRLGTLLGVAQNSITDMNSEFNEDKFNNESGRFGYSANLIAGLETLNGWAFFAGINFSNEVYNYRNQNIEDTSFTEEGVTSFHIDGNGNTNENRGPVTVNSVTNYDLNWHRQHKNIALGIGLAKRIYMLKNFSVRPEVSVLYNISQEHSGYYFSEDSGDIEKFNNGDTNPYNISDNVKYRMGLGIHYNFENISIGLIGTYVYNPNNYLNSSNFYQSKSDLFSTQLSINYYPNW
jgi:hypothetical protein